MGDELLALAEEVAVERERVEDRPAAAVASRGRYGGGVGYCEPSGAMAAKGYNK